VALNTGFASAQGEYLTWTSDDNEFLPTAIEEMVSFLEQNPGIDLVYADFLVHNLDTGQKELRRMPDDLDQGRINCVGACFLYTRRVYEVIGAYDPRYRLVEDYEYWIRVCKMFKAKHLPRTLYVYGEHSKSLTSKRTVGVFMFDGVCKYRYGYISLSELRESMSKFYLTASNAKPFLSVLPKRFYLYLQNIVAVSRLSLPLSLLFLLLLLQLSVSGILKFCVKRIVGSF
jgi:glycosyltransferase involved in cell wall biosynthesis